jgi:hypothetical protein
MESCVPSLVDYVSQGHSETRGEKALQAHWVSCFDEAEDFVSHLFDFELVHSGLTYFVQRLVLFRTLVLEC